MKDILDCLLYSFTPRYLCYNILFTYLIKYKYKIGQIVFINTYLLKKKDILIPNV